MMKTINSKIAFLLMICLLVVSAGSLFVFGEDTPLIPKFEVDSVNAVIGKTVDLPIYISNCEDLRTLNVLIEYDQTAFEITDVRSNLIIPADVSPYFNMFKMEKSASNVLALSAFTTTTGEFNSLEQKKIASIRFKVRDDVKTGTYPVKFIDNVNVDIAIAKRDESGKLTNDVIHVKPEMKDGKINVSQTPVSPTDPGNPGNPGGPGPGKTPTPTPTSSPLSAITDAQVDSIALSIVQRALILEPYEKYEITDFAKTQWDAYTTVAFKTDKNLAEVRYDDIKLAQANAKKLSAPMSNAIVQADGKDTLKKSLTLELSGADVTTSYDVVCSKDFITSWSDDAFQTLMMRTPVFDADISYSVLSQIAGISPDKCTFRFSQDETKGRPVYTLVILDSTGKTIESLNYNGIAVILPITLQQTSFSSEAEAFASYVEESGFSPITGSVYYADKGFYVPLTKAGEITFAVSDIAFEDIGDITWAVPYINGLAARRILSGVGENLFEPNRNITREEFTKLIVASFGLYDETATCSFADVPADSWYYPYVASAVKAGIVNGVGDNLFGVGRQITRQDMATLSKRAADASGKTIRMTQAKADFADAGDISEYAKENIQVMQMAGILSGMGENRFEPGGSATRAQAAKVIYMLFAAQ